MSVLAQSYKRQLLFAKQSGFGTIAAQNASNINVLRRVSTTINHTKNTFESKEIRSDFQYGDMGFGQNIVSGDVVAEIYPGASSAFFGSLVRQAFASVTTSGTTSLAAASGDGWTLTTSGTTGISTLTRAGSGVTFLGTSANNYADGVRLGQVVKFGVWPTTADVGRPAFVVAVTATTVQLAPIDGVPFAAVSSPSTTATLVPVGKQAFIPLTGHTEDAYTFEDVHTDQGTSIVYQDVRVTKLGLKVSPNAYVEGTFSFTGTGANTDANSTTTPTSPYFTGSLAQNTKAGLTGVKALMTVNGVTIPVATGFQLNVDLQATAPQVVAARISPDVLYGQGAKVSGQLTAYVKDASLRALFANETEVPVQIAMYSADETQVLGVYMPRCKITSDTRDDATSGIVQTCSFMALQPLTATVGQIQSSLQFQDSAA